MLHTKLQDHRSTGSGVEDFKGFYHISLSYSTALVLDAGTDNVYLICVFIRFISCLLGKVKY